MEELSEILLEAAADIAIKVEAKAIVSFLKPPAPDGFVSGVPLIWAEDLQLDVLQDLTMHDIMAVSERHLHDAAVQLYLSRAITEGRVVGVLPHSILIYDITETADFIHLQGFEDVVPRNVMFAVIRIALEVAKEGREGRSIGTAFILGQREDVFALSHQAIINPYLGQDPVHCDVTDETNWESVKELSQLDGVFVIEPDGTIISAGRYLDVNAGSVDIPGGFGGRHRATAALTTYIPAIGITVSESGGLVRVFRDGRCLITLRSDVRVKK